MELEIRNNLFVYGTLKKNHIRNGVLDGSEYLGEVKTLARYTMVDLGAFPGILEFGNQHIFGELYSVNKKTLKICDSIEGHPNFYLRKKILLSNKVEAFAYFLVDKKYEAFPKVAFGKWV